MVAERIEAVKNRPPASTVQQCVVVLGVPTPQQTLLRGRLVSSPTGKVATSIVAPSLGDDAQGQRHEAAAYYYFSRLLADESSQLGLAHAAFTEAFLERHAGNSEDGDVLERHANAMREALKAVDGLCQSIEVVVGGDQGAAALGTLGPWLHTSVERCVFAHVGGAVWKLYEDRFKSDDEAFVRKAQVLANEAHDQLILRLGVREALSPARRRIGAAVSPPYARASEALSRLGSSLRSAGHPSPSQVAQLLSVAQLEMRMGALEATRGASELLAMDDVLPVFVFVLLRSELRCPFALAAYAEDALSPEARLGADGWAVRLLESSARYIAHELDGNNNGADEGPTDEKEGTATTASHDAFQMNEGGWRQVPNGDGVVALATPHAPSLNVSEPSAVGENIEGPFSELAFDDLCGQTK
jgi:hypothetical protein